MGLGLKVAAAAFALGIGLSSGQAMAQDRPITTLSELQRAISSENLDPTMQTRMKRFDKDGDGTKETVGRLYFTKDGGRIATYETNGNVYFFGVDSNRKGDFDYTRADYDCDGNDFEVLTPERIQVPNCYK